MKNTADMQGPLNERRFDTRLAGLSLIAAPALLLLANAIDPSASADAAARLPEISDNPARYVAAGHAVFGPGLATRMLEFFGGGRPREPRFPELSAREHEVLGHLANGWTNQRIADELVISPITVRNHVSSILTKLRLTNRREAMLRYHDR